MKNTKDSGGKEKQKGSPEGDKRQHEMLQTTAVPGNGK